MKVCFLVYSLGSGGAEKIVSILLKALSYKYKISLILMSDITFYDIPNNVGVIFLEKSSPSENNINKLLKLPILGWKYKNICKNYDISISFMNRPNYINIFAKIFGAKVKTIISERAMPSFQHKNGIQGKINRILIKLLYKKADKIVANSKGNKFDLEYNFKINNVHLIYNFIKLCKCKKIKQNKFIYINVGRMDEGKNHKLLIQSFNELEIDAELWLIGDGYLRAELEDLASENVKFLGKQKGVYKFLNQADCFVFSSNYEGFPNVLLEALNCGLPIVSTDCRSGPREILAPDTDFRKQADDVEVARYGILTPVGNKEKLKEAMQLIYYDDELRYNYEKKAIKRAEDFSVEKILPQWEKIIEGV